jgi:hypothetical protein
MDDRNDQCWREMAASGITPEKPIEADREIYPLSPSSKQPDDAGRCGLHRDHARRRVSNRS